MPLYEYACADCGHHFEILQSMGADGEGLQCPGCGSKALAKQFSTFSSSVGGEGATASAPMGGCCRGTPT